MAKATENQKGNLGRERPSALGETLLEYCGRPASMPPPPPWESCTFRTEAEDGHARRLIFASGADPAPGVKLIAWPFHYAASRGPLARGRLAPSLAIEGDRPKIIKGRPPGRPDGVFVFTPSRRPAGRLSVSGGDLGVNHLNRDKVAHIVTRGARCHSAP